MEEKWWKKFQTKNEVSSNVKVDDSQSEAVKETEETLHEEPHKHNEKMESGEVFSDAINFIQDLGESIGKTIEEEINNDENRENVKNIINDINEMAKETSRKVNDKTMEFLNSEEVKHAAMKAQEVMKDVVEEVKTWNHENIVHDFPHVIERKNASEIIKDLELTRDKLESAFNSEKVQELKEFANEKYQDVTNVTKGILSDQKIEKGLEKLNQVANDTKKSLEEALEKPSIKPIVEKSVQSAEDIKKWAQDFYNSENVQEGVRSSKEVSKEISESINENINKVVNDPKVNTYYIDSKKAIVKTAQNLDYSVRKTVGPIYIDDSLKFEAREWKDSAIHFTKQSAKLVAKTAIEVKNSEQMHRATEFTKKGVLHLYRYGKDKITPMITKPRVETKEIRHITLNEEELKNREDE